MDPTYRRYREVAEVAARRGGDVLSSMFRGVIAREKGPGDLVTDADLASQRAIVDVLGSAFPEHTILAEEEGLEPDPANPWRWIVDPLDGTINFAHGVSPWCVSIALEHAGALVVGVVHAPWEPRLYSAAIGEGCFVDGVPASPSTASTLSECLICTAFPTSILEDEQRLMRLFRRFSIGTHSVRRTGSSAWNLAQVATGGYDAVYATTMYPWDAAAGVVLIRAAGGRVTSLQGGPYDLYAESILATNGRVHDEAQRWIAEALA